MTAFGWRSRRSDWTRLSLDRGGSHGQPGISPNASHHLRGSESGPPALLASIA